MRRRDSCSSRSPAVPRSPSSDAFPCLRPRRSLDPPRGLPRAVGGCERDWPTTAFVAPTSPPGRAEHRPPARRGTSTWTAAAATAPTPASAASAADVRPADRRRVCRRQAQVRSETGRPIRGHPAAVPQGHSSSTRQSGSSSGTPTPVYRGRGRGRGRGDRAGTGSRGRSRRRCPSPRYPVAPEGPRPGGGVSVRRTVLAEAGPPECRRHRPRRRRGRVWSAPAGRDPPS